MLLGPRRPAGRPYLPAEDDAIRVCLHRHGDLAGAGGRLGPYTRRVRLHARQLGVYRPPPRRRWSEWEDATVRDGYTSALPCAEIAGQLPGRSAAERGRPCAQARAGQLCPALERRRRPAPDAADRARRRPRGHSAAAGVAPPRRSAGERLGSGSTPPPRSPAPRRRWRWTREEDELLRLHQALNPARLAQLLGRSDVSGSPAPVHAWAACPCRTLPASPRQPRPSAALSRSLAERSASREHEHSASRAGSRSARGCPRQGLR